MNTKRLQEVKKQHFPAKASELDLHTHTGDDWLTHWNPKTGRFVVADTATLMERMVRRQIARSNHIVPSQPWPRK